MKNESLILLPLAIMLVLSIVGVAGFGGNSLQTEEGQIVTVGTDNNISQFKGTREVSDTDAEYVHHGATDRSTLDEKGASVEWVYKNFDTDTWKDTVTIGYAPGTYTTTDTQFENAVLIFKKRLDETFGQSNGHKEISENILNYVEYYDNRKGELFPDTDTKFRAWLSIDPQIAEELEEVQNSQISLSSTLFYLGVMVGVIALAAVVGINVLGSGLSNASSGTIIFFVTMFMLWGLMSVGTQSIFSKIPLIGNFIYVLLTFSYSLGCILTSKHL